MNILVGADPELFVLDKGSGEFVNADGMVKGDKSDPYPVKNGAVQVDGMALEFNINPAGTRDEFLENIMVVQQELHDLIGVAEFDLVADASVNFSNEVMSNASVYSLELGCEPDFNAWNNGMINPKPNNNTNLRTGAGHIHIGWSEDEDVQNPLHFEACIDVAKQLDCSLGVESLLWDDNTQRRTMYGKAGAFRPKPYGMEYRVLSNVWLKSEELITHVYDVAVKSVEDLIDGIKYTDNVDARPIINFNNTTQAEIIYPDRPWEVANANV
jgi:hypothetical protein